MAKTCPSRSSLIPVQAKILDEFENTSLSAVDGRCASLAYPRVLVPNLALLVGLNGFH